MASTAPLPSRSSQPASGTRRPSALMLALATVLAAGCAGSDEPTAPVVGSAARTAAALPTAVAGETYSALVSKPTLAPAGAASVAALPADASTTRPVAAGKVRYGVPATATPGPAASLDGTLPFPVEDRWNRDVLRASSDAVSDALIERLGGSTPLRAGFGVQAGVPYAVIDRAQPTVTVRFGDGDGAPVRAWPIPESLDVAGGSIGHLAVIDRDAGLLYELRDAVRAPDGTWRAAGGTAWRLDLADAPPAELVAGGAGDGGMAVFPGLVRPDEVRAGVIRHALRISVPALRDAWLAPALRSAGGAEDGSLPPIGLRLRLKPATTIPADASPAARAILQALKTYGAIVAGTGPFALHGVPDTGWSASLEQELGTVTAADFEVVAADGLLGR
jgi:hypothetical protein